MEMRVVSLRGRFWNVSSVFAHGPSPSIFIRRRHDWTRPMVLVPCQRSRIEDRCGMARCRGYSAIGANAQRPKRFYQNVQVVAVEEERVMETFRKKKDAAHANIDDTTLQQLLFPRTPSPQLVPKEENDSKTAITWHTVSLDEKPLRTPSGKPLYIPSLPLAHGMATEWNAVTENIIPQQMPLMTLTCTVLDQVLHAQNHAAADTFRQQCLQYMATDTVCYHADPKEERPLYQQQNKAWKRLHEWIATSFIQTAASQMAPPAIHICPATTSIYPQKTTTTDSTAAAALHLLEQQNPAVDGSSSHSDPDDAMAPVAVASPLVRVLPHSPALKKAVADWIASLDAWHLVALYVACKETKSFWLGVALLLGQATHDSPSPGADTAWVQTAARVEEEWNIRDWGFVEGQHDYDRLNCAIQLRAVAWLVQCVQPHR
jgi:chaperone required for assembly of F1-ATPase